jgi:ankyrin repeat protein
LEENLKEIDFKIPIESKEIVNKFEPEFSCKKEEEIVPKVCLWQNGFIIYNKFGEIIILNIKEKKSFQIFTDFFKDSVFNVSYGVSSLNEQLLIFFNEDKFILLNLDKRQILKKYFFEKIYGVSDKNDNFFHILTSSGLFILNEDTFNPVIKFETEISNPSFFFSLEEGLIVLEKSGKIIYFDKKGKAKIIYNNYCPIVNPLYFEKQKKILFFINGNYSHFGSLNLQNFKLNFYEYFLEFNNSAVICPLCSSHAVVPTYDGYLINLHPDPRVGIKNKILEPKNYIYTYKNKYYVMFSQSFKEARTPRSIYEKWQNVTYALADENRKDRPFIVPLSENRLYRWYGEARISILDVREEINHFTFFELKGFIYPIGLSENFFVAFEEKKIYIIDLDKIIKEGTIKIISPIDKKELNSKELLYNIENNEIEYINEELIKNSDINSKNKYGETPLIISARNNNFDLCKLLLKNGADVNEVDSGGRTALIFSIINGNRQIFELLLKAKANVKVFDNEGNSPLFHLIRWAVKDACEAFEKGEGLLKNFYLFLSFLDDLINKGLEVDAKNKHGETALMEACKYGGYFYEFLISKGADVNAKNKDGLTPLMYACNYGKIDVCKDLISKGANISERDKEGKTALIHSAISGNAEICELLLSNGANVEEKDNNGKTALWHAVSSNQAKACELLISKGADVNEKNEYGVTLLMEVLEPYVYGTDRYEICEILISNGANINEKDKDGRTALMYAAMGGLEDICKLLISKGAKLEEKDNEGKDAIALAEREGHNNVVEYLKSIKNKN